MSKSARAVQTMTITREFYTLMPDSPPLPMLDNGQPDWNRVTGDNAHFAFCFAIARRIVDANSRTFIEPD